MEAQSFLVAITEEQAFIAISVDSDIVAVPPFIKQNQLTFPIGHDPKMALADRYGMRAVPSSFLIDRKATLLNSR